MIKFDEEALICDLAETYHIYDYKQLTAQQVAVFSCGLRENSRIKMKHNDQVIPFETVLLAGMHDNLSLLLWSKTEAAQKGKNKPKLVLEALRPKTGKKKEVVSFTSGEDFEKAWKALSGEGGDK